MAIQAAGGREQIFHSLNSVFYRDEVLKLNEVPLINFFSFMEHVFGVSEKSSPNPRSPKFSLMLFIILQFFSLYFTFRSMRHFELIL